MIQKESERLREEAAKVAQVEAAYAEVLAGVRTAALLLEAAEPTLAALIKQHEWATGTGAIFDPGLFRRLAGNANVEAQVKLARAVCAFVATWKSLREAALAGG